jgi:N-acyl-D-amino-acid deacylase
VIIFDQQTIADQSTYEQPKLLAAGMKYVIVNGKVAIDGGKFTGTLAGRPVKRIATVQ